MYNNNEWIEDRAPTSGENAALADANWTVVEHCRISKATGENLKVGKISPPVRMDGSEEWRYVKRQCLHCKDPACVSSCFATAFKQNENDLGVVTYYPNLCVGCRYCMLACPFSIPKFEWNKPIPVLTKCTMCHNRIKSSDAPACVSVCPTNVMMFGNREELLKKAKEILANDSRYVRHIYGDEEAGGTAWMYISDKPFEQLGFKTSVPKRSIPSYTEGFMWLTPRFGAIWLVVLSFLYFITKRRSAKKEGAKKEGKKTDTP